MPKFSAISARNLNHPDLLLGSPEDATTDFSTAVAEYREMNAGFVQVIYSGLTDYSGVFSLWVSIICETETLCKLPGTEISPSADCNCVGWNLSDIGYEFLQVRYVANTESSGTIDKIVATGKK